MDRKTFIATMTGGAVAAPSIAKACSKREGKECATDTFMGWEIRHLRPPEWMPDEFLLAVKGDCVQRVQFDARKKEHFQIAMDRLRREINYVETLNGPSSV